MLKKLLPVLILITLLLTGCATASEPTIVPTQEPPAEPTNTEVPPTDPPTAEPTAQPTEEPTDLPPTETPLPEGVIFRDDFNGTLQDGWTWNNEDPSRWSFVENGWLEIVADDVSLFMEEDRGMVNFLTRDLPEGEFEVIAHIQADPNESFEQAAIYIFENEDNYIALNLGFCGICGVGGPGFFIETFIDNNPFGDFCEIPRDAATTEVSLKLVNQDDSIIGYYALPGGEWQRLGAFGHYFDFNSVGLGATNSNLDGVETDIVARFDYFEIREP
jgi:hypothetical protein